MPLATALLLFGVEVWFARSFYVGVPKKGSIAKYTIRAERDAVFDLHQTYIEEAQAAKQSYVPIYNKDKRLLYNERVKIEAAVLAQPLEAWPWPRLGSSEFGAMGGERDAAIGLDLAPPSTQDTQHSLDASVPGEAAYEGEYLETNFGDRDELQALVAGYFRMLEPFYAAGVIADNEFPKEKAEDPCFCRRPLSCHACR